MSNVVAAILLGNGVGDRIATAPHYSTLHEDQYNFLIISRSFLRRMRNVSDKSCRENQNPNFVFSNIFSKILPLMR